MDRLGSDRSATSDRPHPGRFCLLLAFVLIGTDLPVCAEIPVAFGRAVVTEDRPDGCESPLDGSFCRIARDGLRALRAALLDARSPVPAPIDRPRSPSGFEAAPRPHPAIERILGPPGRSLRAPTATLSHLAS